MMYTETNARQAMWQTVLFVAIYDTFYEGTDATRRADQKTADRWIRFGGNDFEEVCALAGFDHEAIQERYVSGKIAPDWVKSLHGPKRPHRSKMALQRKAA